MAIGEDRVQVTKVESTALGGKDSDQGPYDSPVPINAQQDAIESAGGYVQDETVRDETVGWRRINGEFELFDNTVPDGATVNELLEGDDQVKDIIPVGMTFLVKENHQHMVFNNLTIEGEYKIEGQSVILG